MSARDAWEAQAARRTSRANGTETAEDAILRALRSGTDDDLATAARLRASAEGIDHDYLAYWVDVLGHRENWRRLG